MILAPLASAQTYAGSGSCAGAKECHSTRGETDWLTNQPGGRDHRGSIGKLRAPGEIRTKAEGYAKALKMTSFEDPKGICVTCHGMYVEQAKTLEGVGCEGCHGPALGTYLTFHSQNPKEYKGSVGKGMNNLLRNPVTWVALCVNCHVLKDRPEYKELLEVAEHPDYGNWSVTRGAGGGPPRFQLVAAHWKTVTYSVDDIVKASKGVLVVAPPPPAPPPSPSPPAPVSPPPPAPVTTSATPPAPGTTTMPPAAGSPATTTIRRTGSASTSTMATTSTIPPQTTTTTIPPGPVTSSPLDLKPPPPTTASGMAAALQDRVLSLLATLLQSNRAPARPLVPPPVPKMFTGQDAELLRLQAEAIALAVEALNMKVPAKSGATAPSGGARQP